MKSNHNRLKYLLTALMVTSMIAVLIWTFASIQVSADNGGLQALQAENDQLRQTIVEMQARENTFRTQIQKANETIFQLIDQPEPASAALGSLQTENSALHEKVNILEQQLQQQTSKQSSFSFDSHEEEEEEQEHEGG